MNRKPTISVCMIVKDEEKNLPRVLSSIKGLADEVIVVDTGSSDNTVEMARSFGASVHFFDWCDDFSAARNESLKYATKDYILWLDADDELTREGHYRILKHLRRLPGTAAMLVVKCPEDKVDLEALQLRVFPNRRGIRFEGRIHEQVQPSIEKQGIAIHRCDAMIVHYGYMDAGFGAEKLQRNLRIAELDVIEHPESMSALFSMARSLLFFGKSEEAVSYLDSMIVLAQNDPNMCRNATFEMGICMKAEILSEWGRSEEAVSLLEQYSQLLPDSVLLRRSLGETYFSAREYDKAFRELAGLREDSLGIQTALTSPTESKRLTRQRLGVAALLTGNRDAAEGYLLTAIREEPAEVSNYHCLSVAREREGDLSGAIDACLLGLKQAQDGGLRKRLFFLLTKAERFAEALKEYENLNGNRADVDALTARFFIGCKTLNITDIHQYYGMIRQGIGLGVNPFPEGLEETRSRIEETDPRSYKFFETAVSFLMNMAVS
jgi:glycosyltransferase involved in cell wall biosynthesis